MVWVARPCRDHAITRSKCDMMMPSSHHIFMRALLRGCGPALGPALSRGRAAPKCKLRNSNTVACHPVSRGK